MFVFATVLVGEASVVVAVAVPVGGEGAAVLPLPAALLSAVRERGVVSIGVCGGVIGPRCGSPGSELAGGSGVVAPVWPLATGAASEAPPLPLAGAGAGTETETETAAGGVMLSVAERTGTVVAEAVTSADGLACLLKKRRGCEREMRLRLGYLRQ